MKKILLMLAAAMTVASGISAQTSYVNETSKVGTSKEAWHGTGMYGNKSVTPLGGTAVNLAEHYYSPKNGWSNDKFVPEVGVKPLYQAVSGLKAGTYKVEFFVTAHKANDEGDSFALTEPSNTINCAYVKVGDKVATKQNFQSIANNGLAADEPILMTFDKVAIAEGENLEMGIEIMEKGKTNWYTIQISSLQREATEAEILQNEVNVMNENKAKLQTIINKYQYATNAAKEPYKNLLNELESVDTTSLEAVKEANTKITTLLGDTLKERKLAEENAVLAGLEGVTHINIINPDGGSKTGSITDQETTDTHLLDGWYAFRNGEIDFNPNKSGQSPTLSDGTLIATYFDGYKEAGKNYRIAVQQMVQLEPGEYRLSLLNRAGPTLNYFRMLAVVGHDDAKNRLEGFITNNDSEVPGYVETLIQEGGDGGLFGNGWGMSYLDFTVKEPTTPASAPAKEGENVSKQNVCISVQAGTGNNNSGRWMSFTHFQLVKKPKDIGSGISSAVVEDVNAPVEYFDLNGIRVNADNLKKGIYIKRQGNKVTKIIK